MAVRSFRRNGYPLFLSAVLVLLTAGAGCQSLLFTAAYLWQGQNAEAEFKGLKGKRVAVVCRPLVSLQYRNASAAKDIAREVSLLLKSNVPKIKLVDQSKVAEWMDEHTWEEYVEVGKAVKADMVVGIDLEQFDLLLGQTVYQGKASVEVKVYDCATGACVFTKRPPQSVYPPNHVISTMSKQEADFRREFVAVLADQIGRHFYDHDPHADIALDSRALD